jgi:hypothetical protein
MVKEGKKYSVKNSKRGDIAQMKSEEKEFDRYICIYVFVNVYIYIYIYIKYL